jgi:hypothetical protein
MSEAAEMTATNKQPSLDEVWYLALHCRMFLYSHAQILRLGLMETGAPADNPVEANYHQFAAVHLLATLTVVDKGRGYVDHALESLELSGFADEIRAIAETVIYGGVSFGAALRAHRNYDRTHGNIFVPHAAMSQSRQAEARRAYEAANVAPGRQAFNDCWLKLRDALERLADRLDQKMEQLAPPPLTKEFVVLPEHLPRQGGPLGLHRPPRFVGINLDQAAVQDYVLWRLPTPG